MKAIKYIAVAFAGASMMFASSCTDSVDYTPAAPQTGYEVYFSDQEATEVDLVVDATTATVNLSRVKTAGELTVALTSTVTDVDGEAVEGIFTVPSQVTFADGQAVAPIVLGVEFDKVVPAQNYLINIKIGSEETPYGQAEQTFTVSYSPWLDYELNRNGNAYVTYTFPFQSAIYLETKLYSQKSVLSDDVLRFTAVAPDEFRQLGWDLDIVFDIDYSQYTLNEDNDTCYVITTPSMPAYFADDEGLCTLIDGYSWHKEIGGYTAEEAELGLANKGWERSYFNSKTGVAYLNLCAYPAAMEFGYLYNEKKSFTYTVEFPGYVNYAMEFVENGHYVDVTGEESQLIQVYKTSNLAYFACDFAEGALTNDEVAALAQQIIDDKDKEFYSESGANVLLPISKNGTYTLVAVGYDEGYNAVYTASYVFEFETVKSESEWEKYGEADYTEAFFMDVYGLLPVTYPVQVERNIENPGIFRLVNPYADWTTYGGYKSYLQKGNHYLTLDCTDPTAVNILESDLGISLIPEYGYLSVTSLANIFMESGQATYDQLKAYGYFGVLEDGVITFPAGTICGALSGFYDGEWVFFLNLDPQNPTDPDSESYDPFWGEGLFNVAIYNLMDAAAGVKPNKSPKASAKDNSNISLKEGRVIAPRKHKIRLLSEKEAKSLISKEFVRANF